ASRAPSGSFASCPTSSCATTPVYQGGSSAPTQQPSAPTTSHTSRSRTSSCASRGYCGRSLQPCATPRWRASRSSSTAQVGSVVPDMCSQPGSPRPGTYGARGDQCRSADGEKREG